MIELKLAKSYALLDQAYQYFNTLYPKYGQRLTANHKNLMKGLFWLQKKQATNYQLYGQPDTSGYYMRGLRTNCEQLAQMMCCTTRTIRNLRARMEKAGWIKCTFHGSNGALEIDIHRDLLYLQDNQDRQPKNVAPMFSNCLEGRKIFPHTLSSVTRQDTSKLNELSGVDLPQVADPEIGKLATAVEKPEIVGESPSTAAFGRDTKPGTGTGYKPRGTQKTDHLTGRNQVTPPKVPRKGSRPAAKPQHGYVEVPHTLPEKLKSVVGHLSRHRQHQLARYVRTMWNAAKSELYHSHYLDERQEALAQVALSEYLAYSDPARWKVGANEVITRIQLVRRWIDRRHDAGKKAFVPIPEIYFDFRNERGFRATKTWYKQHLRNLTQIKNKELLTKARNEYLRSLEPNATTSPTETLRRILQRLGKRSQELAREFKTAVLDVVTAA